MRASTIAAVLGFVVTASSAYAQSASVTMTVSVRVVRNCTIPSEPGTSGADPIVAQCTGTATPKTQLSAPMRVLAPVPPPAEGRYDARGYDSTDATLETPRPSTPPAESRAFRVLTVNF